MENSTSGYIKEIKFLQLWQIPFWIINERIGTFLYNGIFILHLGQNDRGKIIDKLFGNLNITTLIKLPNIRPKIKNKQ